MNQNIQKVSRSYVRIFHASIEAPAVDVYVDGMLAAKELMYSYFTDYVMVPVGKHIVDVYVAGTVEQPVISGELNLLQGVFCTIAAFGELEELMLGVIMDMDGVDNNNLSKIRCIHIFPGAPAVSIIANKKVLAQTLNYANMTPYSDVYPGYYNVRVSQASNGEMIMNFMLQAIASTPATVYITGATPEKEVFCLIDGKNANEYYKFES